MSATGSGSSRTPGRGRVVISSVTGEPIPWDDAAPEEPDAPDRPILPDRVAADAPEPGESNDARLTGDLPPHWGRGQ